MSYIQRLMCKHNYKINRVVSFNGQRIVLKHSYNVKLIYNTYTCKFICGVCGKIRYVTAKKLVRVEELKYQSILNIYEDNMRAHINKKLPKGVVRGCQLRG